MMELGKAHNITHEMERLKVKILGISEARWKGTGKTVIQDTQSITQDVQNQKSPTIMEWPLLSAGTLVNLLNIFYRCQAEWHYYNLMHRVDS